MEDQTITWLEIIDTAVKIGLGAVITGILSIIVVKSSHKHELNKEYTRRVQDALEIISGDIEVSHEFMCKLGAKACVYVERKSPEPPSKDTVLAKECLNSTRKLIAIEGKLQLFGLWDTTLMVEKFRVAIGEFQEKYRTPQDKDTVETIQNEMNKITRIRADIYTQLAKAYKAVQQ